MLNLVHLTNGLKKAYEFMYIFLKNNKCQVCSFSENGDCKR